MAVLGETRVCQTSTGVRALGGAALAAAVPAPSLSTLVVIPEPLDMYPVLPVT